MSESQVKPTLNGRGEEWMSHPAREIKFPTDRHGVFLDSQPFLIEFLEAYAVARLSHQEREKQVPLQGVSGDEDTLERLKSAALRLAEEVYYQVTQL
jgi:hypothetical protein